MGYEMTCNSYLMETLKGERRQAVGTIMRVLAWVFIGGPFVFLATGCIAAVFVAGPAMSAAHESARTHRRRGGQLGH